MILFVSSTAIIIIQSFIFSSTSFKYGCVWINIHIVSSSLCLKIFLKKYFHLAGTDDDDVDDDENEKEFFLRKYQYKHVYI